MPPASAPTIPDRILWTIVLGAVTGAAALLAARGAEWAWQRLRGGPPPRPIGFIGSLARRASESALS